ncbi:hypothetical protein EV182_006035, partial [Spiromyces aspiralis]
MHTELSMLRNQLSSKDDFAFVVTKILHFADNEYNECLLSTVAAGSSPTVDVLKRYFNLYYQLRRYWLLCL